MAKEGSYQQAGVDIKAGRDFVEQIAPLAKATMRAGAASALGGFGGVFDLAAAGLRDPLLVAATDGVGTKLMLAQQAGRWQALGQDLVAMCVNDLIAQGAAPLFFLDYIACGKIEAGYLIEIVAGMSDACRASQCALIGGETAEMPQLYQPSEFDLAGFAVGAVERERLLPKDNAAIGDKVLGLASDGVHANGFSLVRKILTDQKITLDQALSDSLLRPTRLYVAAILKALEEDNLEIKGIAHITGGGLIENLPRALPNPTLSLIIDRNQWEVDDIFPFLQKKGDLSDEEMLNVFNCGIGLALIVAEKNADAVIASLTQSGERVFAIGHVAANQGEKIIITR